jgi:hypothetical protein
MGNLIELERERADLLERLSELSDVSLWDDRLVLLNSIPLTWGNRVDPGNAVASKEWDGFIESLWDCTWIEVPFAVESADLAGPAEKLGGNERLHCARLGFYWSVWLKDEPEDIRVETHFFPKINDLERLALCGEED